MAVVFEIDGANALDRYESGTLDVTKDGTVERLTCQLTIDEIESTTWRPVEGMPVYLEEDGQVLFGGTIEDVEETALAQPNRAGLRFGITAVDYQELTDFTLISALTIPADTSTLAAYELVRAASIGPRWGIPQVGVATGGPLLAEMVFSHVSAREAFETIRRASGYPWRIAGGPGFFAHAPGGIAGPSFNATNANIHNVFGRRRTRLRRLTRVWVQISSPHAYRVETKVGDGIRTSWPLDLEVATPPTSVEETVSGTPTVYAVDGSRWDYDPDLMRLEKVAGGPLASGDTVSYGYTPMAPGYCRAEDEAAVLDGRIIEQLIARPEIVDPDAGLTVAAQVLAAQQGTPEALELGTDEVNVYPELACPVSVPSRQVSGTYHVTRVSIRDIGRKLTDAKALFSTVSLVAAGEVLETPIDFWRSRMGSGGAGSVAFVGGGSGGTVIVQGRRPHRWGGSRTQTVLGSGWQPVWDWAPFVGDGLGPRVVRVICRTEHAATSVTPRIARWSGSAWVEEVVGESSTATTADGEEQALPAFSPEAGVRYRLECQRNNENAWVYVLAWE